MIDKNTHTTSYEICENRFHQILRSSLKNGYSEFESFFGKLTQDYVNQVSLEIEERLFENGIKKTTIKRLFTIMVEGLQNVRLHGQNTKTGTQSTFFILTESDDNFEIYLGNVVLNTISPKFKKELIKLTA